MKKTVKNEQYTILHPQYCINKTMSNIVLDVIWIRLTNNHITMTRQESKLLRPTETIIVRLHYSILYTVNARPERQLRSSYVRIKSIHTKISKSVLCSRSGKN